ncbi:MAG: prepilin-type N-terminal cleavage/methylation domain-containing protein [Phycisphaerales bacterium]|nr:MAG: prepilin-type N-terminal cleavage/methylation domain-containing protein [Phycisphaerales bacterium]
MRAKRGFTLVEILIVVVILGILAAIVVPQFTQASTEAKVSSTVSDLQSIRGQIGLYMIQHNDNPPTVALFEEAMTLCSDAEAAVLADYVERTAANKPTHPYGPYMVAIPANPWNNSRTVAAAAAADNGWVYDEVTADIWVDWTDADADVVQTLEDQGAVPPGTAAAAP